MKLSHKEAISVYTELAAIVQRMVDDDSKIINHLLVGSVSTHEIAAMMEEVLFVIVVPGKEAFEGDDIRVEG